MSSIFASDAAASFAIEVRGGSARFRIVDECTIGAEGERRRVFIWQSSGLIENFCVHVEVAADSVEQVGAAAILEAATERAALEIERSIFL